MSPSLRPALPLDPDYPRPQLVRPAWLSLDGPWRFAFDDADAGRAAGWSADPTPLQRTITVPFPPESPASGIGDTAPHRVMWYQREVTAAQLDQLTAAIGGGARLVLHVGAADHHADVWLDGRHAAAHDGGHTPFCVDVTDLLTPGAATHAITIRCEDDPSDLEQPRGKQDWADEPHAVWYHRTSGLWQPVWLEAVPARHVTDLTWSCDVPAGQVSAEITLNGAPSQPLPVTVELSHAGRVLAATTTHSERDRLTVTLQLPAPRTEHDFDELLWTPENPVLIDARVTVGDDAVASYLGLRSVATERGRFLLNGRPYRLLSVLAQGYWPESHLAAPSADALRAEVQLIKDLGFNAVRVHQKIEDPRFLAWCDQLGLAAWGEFPAAYDFTARAVERTVHEWTEAVRRDASHPAIVAWVPCNESWGVAHISDSRAQREFTRALAALTRALDPSRPVISNDGWEHTDSDIVTIHDYEEDPAAIVARYGDAEAVARLLRGFGPAGRRLLLPPDSADAGATPATDAPVMLTEFGGIKCVAGSEAVSTWGYSAADDAADFERRLRALFAAVHACRGIDGFCYTQLTDTLQEANGLTDERRRPKLPAETIAQIVRG